MQTPVRYYITCDDDRPVVRTIPVAVRNHQGPVDQPVVTAAATPAALDASPENRTPRVSKRALAKARRLRGRAHRS